MRTQYITDNVGKKVAIILPIKDYQKMIEELEELDDIRLFDEAKKNKSKGILMEEAFKQLTTKRKKHALQGHHSKAGSKRTGKN